MISSAHRRCDGWHHWAPGVANIRGYRWHWFRNDLQAGLSVAACLVPQSMAYADTRGTCWDKLVFSSRPWATCTGLLRFSVPCCSCSYWSLIGTCRGCRDRWSASSAPRSNLAVGVGSGISGAFQR